MTVKTGFNGHLSEFGSLVKLTFLNRFRPQVETGITPRDEGPRAKRARISRFANNLKTTLGELKHVIASSGYNEPFFPSPFGRLPPKKKHLRRGRRPKYNKKQERWLAEPGTGDEPELRPGCVKPVFESRVSNPGPERTMAEPAFVGNLGERGRNCELQPRGLGKEPGIVTDREASGLVASRGNLENLASGELVGTEHTCVRGGDSARGSLSDSASVCSSKVRSDPGEPARMAAPFARFSSQHPMVNGMVTPVLESKGTGNNPGQQGARPFFVGDFGERDRNCELQPRGLSNEPGGLATDREASGLVAARGNLGNLASEELVDTEHTCN